jgi:hypothetical protein
MQADPALRIWLCEPSDSKRKRKTNIDKRYAPHTFRFGQHEVGRVADVGVDFEGRHNRRIWRESSGKSRNLPQQRNKRRTVRLLRTK